MKDVDSSFCSLQKEAEPIRQDRPHEDEKAHNTTSKQKK